MENDDKGTRISDVRRSFEEVRELINEAAALGNVPGALSLLIAAVAAVNNRLNDLEKQIAAKP